MVAHFEKREAAGDRLTFHLIKRSLDSWFQVWGNLEAHRLTCLHPDRLAGARIHALARRCGGRCGPGGRRDSLHRMVIIYLKGAFQQGAQLHNVWRGHLGC